MKMHPYISVSELADSFRVSAHANARYGEALLKFLGFACISTVCYPIIYSCGVKFQMNSTVVCNPSHGPLTCLSTTCFTCFKLHAADPLCMHSASIYVYIHVYNTLSSHLTVAK